MIKPMLVDGSACLSSPKKWSTSRISSMNAEVSASGNGSHGMGGGLTSTFLSAEASFHENKY